MMNNHSTCTDLKNNFNNSKIIEKCNHFGTESNCPCGKEKGKFALILILYNTVYG